MKSRICGNSYVMGFLDIGFNSNQIEATIKTETDDILKMIKIEELEDWEIEFNFIFDSGEEISIYKKLPSYKKEKQKVIDIHIPIPFKANVDWGIEENQHVKIGSGEPNVKNVSLLEVSFKDFHNRTDYITDCMRRAIKFCFENGFTVNGVKIKLREI